MKYIYMILIVALTAAIKNSYAQDYYVDALRFSQYQSGSSARIKGIGNAQTAIGGDVSSISGNPAGLGFFTKSELSLTPQIMNSSSVSTFLGENTNASKGKFGINNLGAVFVIKLGKYSGDNLSSGPVSFNVGLGYAKTNDFGNKILFSGTNTNNSIANFYAQLGNESTGTSLEGGSVADAAYESNLINYSNGMYIPVTNANPKQDEIIIRNGYQSEFNIAAGLNVSNKFYIGGSIGILGLNYSSDNTFTETGTLSYSDNNGNYNENYRNNYYQRYDSEGSGLNAKLGVIFKPSPFLRLGASVKSPNWYNIDDSYSESLRTRLTNNPYFEDSEVKSQNQLYESTYNLRTPARFSLGAAVFPTKLGFITADVEFVDYSSMKLSEADYDDASSFIEDNRFIVNNFKSTVNYRIGAEIKATPQMMVRGGYGVTGSPMENTEQDLEVKSYSLGLGYRSGNLSIDLAYQNSSFNSSTAPYTLSNGSNPIADTKSTRSGVFFTIGSRF